MGWRRTGGVGKLVLLALYPVLEGLGIAAGDLDLLLDRLLVRVGHGVRLRLRLRLRLLERDEGQAQRARCCTIRCGTAQYGAVGRCAAGSRGA